MNNGRNAVESVSYGSRVQEVGDDCKLELLGVMCIRNHRAFLFEVTDVALAANNTAHTVAPTQSNSKSLEADITCDSSYP
jgi:hypothetical protein